MTFTTFSFALFLPLVFGLYWSLRRKTARNLLLVGASYLFYGWWDWRFCGLMLLSSLIDYAVGRGLGSHSSAAVRRRLLALSVVGNLGILGLFKYFGFFAESLRQAVGLLGLELDPWSLRIVLPVGISFYTFQSLGYSIDVFRREVEPCRNLVDFLAFVSFFPQLVAGPIERASSLLPQIAVPRRFDPELATDGCRQILWGAFKKTVIADNLALVVETLYAQPGEHSGPQLALATVCFAFQIYCDFSGYSDIAIGCAKVFGIRLRQNFDVPYFSRSLGEFWHRWHISLSTWFRDYVYIPLGGNRRGETRRDVNALATFLLSGLWHGAAWNFVLWGGLHGLGVVAEWRFPRVARGPRPDEPAGGPGRLPRPAAALRMALTFAAVSAGWVFFRAESIGDVGVIFGRLATDSFSRDAWAQAAATAQESLIPLLAVVLLLAVEWLRRGLAHPLQGLRKPIWWRWSLYLLLVLSICELAPARGREFIYFQF